jgi:hypothetical protein
MAINPNHIPWLSVVGIVGAGLGHGLGQWIGFAGEPMLPALYGLCAGTVGGLVIRIVIRQRTLKQARLAEASEPDDGDQAGRA